MDYEAAKAIRPGDVILYNDGWELREAVVTGEVHVFRPPRGRVVYVPIEGAMIVHTKITQVDRA